MTAQNHGGKGSAQRPVDQVRFNDNWDRIFNAQPSEEPKADEREVGSDIIREGSRKMWGICIGRHLT